ncbi:MAG: hypothetical protein ACXAC7_10905 [Candidatus Hodarchaeales archaeon]|jgi:hypothetical protein
MNSLVLTELEQFFLAFFLIVHGLIHIVFLFHYFSKDEKAFVGWSGQSWLLGKMLPSAQIKNIGRLFWILIPVIFVLSGLSIFDFFPLNEYLIPLVVIASLIAIIAFIIFYDGLAPTPFHWVLGLIINVVLIIFTVFLTDNINLLPIILILITLYGILFHTRILTLFTTLES